LGLLLPTVLALSGALLVGLTVRAGTLDDVGYNTLVFVLDQLGKPSLNGAGVPISMVEAANGNTGAYFPDEANPEFSADTDPLGQDVTFIDASGGKSKGVSPHANSTVGNRFFGNQVSMAGAANQVTVYEAGGWMAYVLNTANHQAPRLSASEDYRVQNFSWVSTDNSSSAEAENRDVLQRFDYLIDTYDLTALVGLNNNPDNISSPLPHLLSHSYNAIAVGRSDGKHSTGLTQSFYGPGRSKPDLVVPVGSTSGATAVASSAATLLHEAASEPEGTHSEVIKAMLLAGATKDEFPAWNHTTTQPLDDTYGAGELNIFNSWKMINAGRTAGGSTDPSPSTPLNASGWDYQSVDSSSDWYYTFEVADGFTVGQLSIVLAWNASVDDTNSGSPFSGEVSLANLDLSLYDSTSQLLGTLLDESVSTVDNVEHIYIGPDQGVDSLGPGTYTLKVSQWTADFDADGDIDGEDFLIWQRGFGITEGALNSDGDANGDGAVDSNDLALLQKGFGTVPQSQDFGLAWLSTPTLDQTPPLAIAAVPEPSTLVLALLVAMAGWETRHRKIFLGRQSLLRTPEWMADG